MSQRWLTWANGLSVVRPLIALPCAYAILAGRWRVAAALFVLAVVTDIADGPLARRMGHASALGGLMDHTSDALYVAITLGALSLLDTVPTVLPFLVCAAFVQYVLDSKSIVGEPLRASVIGRYNGIAYFVLLGTPVVRDALGLGFPGAGLLLLLGWALVASTLLSMADRAWAFARSLTRGSGQAPPQVNP